MSPLVCPVCGSPRVHRSRRRGLEKLLLLFRRRPYRCHQCDRRFYGRLGAPRPDTSQDLPGGTAPAPSAPGPAPRWGQAPRPAPQAPPRLRSRRRTRDLALFAVVGGGVLLLAGSLLVVLGPSLWRRVGFRGAPRADAAAPRPAAPTPPPAAPVPTAVPEPSRETARGPVPAVASSAAGFRVQLGAFRTAQAAEDLADLAKRRNLAVKVLGPGPGRESRLHHVLLDTLFEQQLAAEQTAAEMRRKHAIKAIVLKAD